MKDKGKKETGKEKKNVNLSHLLTGSTDTERTYLGAGRGDGLGLGRVEGPLRAQIWLALGRALREGEPRGSSVVTDDEGAALFIGDARDRLADDSLPAAAAPAPTPTCCVRATRAHYLHKVFPTASHAHSSIPIFPVTQTVL